MFWFRKTINTLAIKLEEYWKEIRHKRKQEDPNCIPVEDTVSVHFEVIAWILHLHFSRHVVYMLWYLPLSVSLGSGQIKTGRSVMPVWNGANSRMGSIAASCQKNGTALWTLILSSGKQSSILQSVAIITVSRAWFVRVYWNPWKCMNFNAVFSRSEKCLSLRVFETAWNCNCITFMKIPTWQNCYICR